MPNFLQHRHRARGRADVRDFLAVDEDLALRPGRRIPSTHLIVTDLPVPEPPMTTSDSPALDREIDAVQHDLGAEAFLHAAQFDLGSVAMRHHSPRTERR